jgi:hypothetical protein
MMDMPRQHPLSRRLAIDLLGVASAVCRRDRASGTTLNDADAGYLPAAIAGASLHRRTSVVR